MRVIKQSMKPMKPLVSFGLLSDVQYADVDDGWNFHQTAQRYYRNALTQLQNVVLEWTRDSVAARAATSTSNVDATATPLAFAVNLGDLIDGKNKLVGTSQAALDATKAAWQPFLDSVGPVHHLVGNHELYNFPPAEIHRQLLWWSQPPQSPAAAAKTACSTTTAAYYDFTWPSAPSTRFVVLNCYGLSTIGRTLDDPVALDANRLLREYNTNENLNSPFGLKGLDERFVAFNGAVDAAQLAWLVDVLANAAALGEHVVLFTHIPLHPATSGASSLLWNYTELLDVIYTAGCVRVVFSGHTHADGYVEENGVHFVVCDAILECEPHETAHMRVHVFTDRFVVDGRGKIASRELMFPSSVVDEKTQ